MIRKEAISYEDLPNMVSPRMLRMFLNMRLATILREKCGSTDEELLKERELEEACNFLWNEAYLFEGNKIPNGCFVVTTHYHDTIPYTVEELVELMVTEECGTIGTDILEKAECN